MPLFRVIKWKNVLLATTAPYAVIALKRMLGEIGEEYRLQTSRRTSADTFPTSGAFGVVDHSTVVDNGNGIVRASALALFTTDASVFTSLARVGTLVLVVAENRRLRFLRNHGDELFGTSHQAHAATDTTAGVNASNSVLDTDRI